MILLAMLFLVRLAMVLPQSARQNDFAHYYLSSRLLLEGQRPYNVDLRPLAEAQGFEFDERVPRATNPPLLLWGFAPFAALPAQIAFWAWVAVQVASLALILVLTRGWLPAKLTARAWLFFVAAILTSGVVYWHFRFSQVQLPLAALVLVAYGWLRRGRSSAACLAVTLAGLVKLFPLALLPWFIWRGGRTLAERGRLAILSALVGGLLVMVSGPRLWQEFAAHAGEVLSANAVGYSFNFTLPSLVINLGYASQRFTPSPAAAHFWWLLGLAAGGMTLLLVYALCWWRPASLAVEFSRVSIAMLVGSLTAWGHYQVFLIFPLALALAVTLQQGRPRSVVMLTLAAVLLSVQGTVGGSWVDDHWLVGVLANQLPLAGMVVLACLLELNPQHPANSLGQSPANETPLRPA